TVLKDLDIWKEVGTNKVLKKMVKAKIQGGKLIVSFPNCKVGQAVISGIAIASLKSDLKRAPSYNLVSNTIGAAGWIGWVDEGYETAFGSKPGIAALPPSLFGSSQLAYKSKDKRGPVSFDLADTADVFAAIIDSVKYGWMDGYENTGKHLHLSDGKNYTVWRKRFPAGNVKVNTEKFPLVFVQPAVDMQPAYDLKPVTAYKTHVAKLTGTVSKEQFEKREVAMVKDDSKATVEWPVLTGVADIYSITLKYYWPGEQPVNATLELIGPGNSRMMTQPVNLTFTRQGKWNQVTVNTGSQINAGNYVVRLITEKAKGLAISGIDVQ
ncbi:MAG: glycoside hydrolase family 2, partial [Chitinophagaceae bacterium]|nr:glycoside hydrolase family 2 [Chitinophagaceae bacterium]